jgi:predicted nuclease of restriction endonuclease-like (RecB) superfamily
MKLQRTPPAQNPAGYQPGYPAFLAAMKERILQARTSAARAVNRDLVLLYWDIGRAIVEKQAEHKWGDAVVEQLARDLQEAFPSVTGFAARSLWNMRRLYSAYAAGPFLQQAAAELRVDMRAAPFLPQSVAEISSSHGGSAPEEAFGDAASVRALVAEVPWGHNLLLLDKVPNLSGRLFYLRATTRLGWSRNVLLTQIKAGAYERAVTEGKTHNFAVALPEHLAEQADEMLKSRYSLEFLGIGRAMKERELEDRLVAHLQQFILELGYGFCFVGRQHRLALGRKEYFVDLLFYHRFLKVLVAFDLKVGAFEPEHAGKMDFYLNLLNEKERAPDDRPSIGVILCAEKDGLEVEFALKTKANPIGVAEYRLQSKLPEEFKGKLPSAKQLTDAVRSMLPRPSHR